MVDIQKQTATLLEDNAGLTAEVTDLKERLSSSIDEITDLTSRAAELEEQSRAIISAVEKVLPSVVFIVTDTRAGEQVAGSGVILRSEGYILTNRHVVHNARKVTVTLHDRRNFESSSIIEDDILDLAVVKIDGGLLAGSHSDGKGDCAAP